MYTLQPRMHDIHAKLKKQKLSLTFAYFFFGSMMALFGLYVIFLEFSSITLIHVKSTRIIRCWCKLNRNFPQFRISFGMLLTLNCFSGRKFLFISVLLRLYDRLFFVCNGQQQKIAMIKEEEKEERNKCLRRSASQKQIFQLNHITIYLIKPFIFSSNKKKTKDKVKIDN